MKGVIYVTNTILCSVGTRRTWTAREKLSASQRNVRGWKPFILNSSVCVSHPAVCIPCVTPRIPEWGIAQSCIHSPSAPPALLERLRESRSWDQECKWEVTFSDWRKRRIVTELLTIRNYIYKRMSVFLTLYPIWKSYCCRLIDRLLCKTLKNIFQFWTVIFHIMQRILEHTSNAFVFCLVWYKYVSSPTIQSYTQTTLCECTCGWHNKDIHPKYTDWKILVYYSPVHPVLLKFNVKTVIHSQQHTQQTFAVQPTSLQPCETPRDGSVLFLLGWMLSCVVIFYMIMVYCRL